MIFLTKKPVYVVATLVIFAAGLFVFFTVLTDPWKKKVDLCFVDLDKAEHLKNLRDVTERFAELKTESGLSVFFRRDAAYRAHEHAFYDTLLSKISLRTAGNIDLDTAVTAYQLIFHVVMPQKSLPKRESFATLGTTTLDRLLAAAEQGFGNATDAEDFTVSYESLRQSLVPLAPQHAAQIDEIAKHTIHVLADGNLDAAGNLRLMEFLSQIESRVPAGTDDECPALWRILISNWHTRIRDLSRVEPEMDILQQCRDIDLWAPQSCSGIQSELWQVTDEHMKDIAQWRTMVSFLCRFDAIGARKIADQPQVAGISGDRSRWLHNMIENVSRLYEAELDEHPSIFKELYGPRSQENHDNMTRVLVRSLRDCWKEVADIVLSLPASKDIAQIESTGLWACYPPGRRHLDQFWFAAITDFSQTLENPDFLMRYQEFPSIPGRIREQQSGVVAAVQGRLQSAFRNWIERTDDISNRQLRLQQAKAALESCQNSLLAASEKAMLLELIAEQNAVMLVRVPAFRPEEWLVEISGETPEPGGIVVVENLAEGTPIDVLWTRRDSRMECEPFGALVFSGGSGALASAPDTLSYRKVVIDHDPDQNPVVRYKLLGPTEWLPVNQEFKDDFQSIAESVELATNRNYLFVVRIPGYPTWEKEVYLSSSERSPYVLTIPRFDDPSASR